MDTNSNSVNGQSKRCHIVVVGAGVVGCSVAYRLAHSGFAVTLIERDAVAAHASGHNAGNLNPLHGTPVALVPDTLAAFQRHAEIRAELAQLGYLCSAAMPVRRVHLGCHNSGHTGSGWRHLEETAALYNSTAGFSAAWLDRDDLRRMEPRLASEIGFGIVTSGGLTIDSHVFTCSLAAAAQRFGAVLVTATVAGVRASGNRLTGVNTTAGPVDCDEAVFATGPWVMQTKSWLGVDLAIEPVKGELLLVRLPGDAPQYDFTLGNACLYRRRDNEVWLGGTTSYCGLDEAPTSDGRKFLLDQAARIMPDIRQATLLDHIAALRPIPASGAPIACRAEGWQNVYIANGGGAKGVLLSALIAARVHNLLVYDSTEVPLENRLS